MSLADNNALVTAAGNDVGYDAVFAEQLKTLLSPSDVVLAISASGNSPNVIKAVEYANHAGGVTIGFTGFDGGRLRELVQETAPSRTRAGEKCKGAPLQQSSFETIRRASLPLSEKQHAKVTTSE